VSFGCFRCDNNVTAKEHEMADDYERRSYGDTAVGFGAKPGIVVVDFMVAFTDPQYPLGGAPLVLRAFENTIKMLEVARRYNVPIASCNTAYMNEREMPYWKISAVRDTFLHDHPSAPIDPRVHDPSYDLTVCKKGPSIFFNTGVAEYFNKERVDTVIVTGCNTSGCIRATAVDSSAIATGRSFRKIVSGTSRNSRTATTCATSAAAMSISATLPACSPTSKNGGSRTRDRRRRCAGDACQRGH
jgi:maleamate amidohydrolase